MSVYEFGNSFDPDPTLSWLHRGALHNFRCSTMPPVPPIEFAAELDCKQFTNGSDVEPVKQTYKAIFTQLANARDLDYSERDWSFFEGMKLLKVLPYFKNLKSLNLRGNARLCWDGHFVRCLVAYALSFEQHCNLTVNLQECGMTPECHRLSSHNVRIGLIV